MTTYWLSMVGLGLLVLMWLKGLVDALRSPNPPEFTLDEGTPPDPLPTPPPSLSVVIPARNEAANIEICVRAALAIDWPGRLEVIVVDDRSDDGTGEILAKLNSDDRLIVVPGADPPGGWLGKPHALHLGQQRATGDWLLFVDADVRLFPQGPRHIVGRAIAQGAEMASALGRLIVTSFWERVLQTRMGAIIAGGNPLDEVNNPEKTDRALANGQCLLFSRGAYDRLGGHEAIRGSVLDDVDFAKRAKSEGEPYRLYFGPAVFECRMYTGLGEIWNGWTKNLFPALHYSLLVTLVVTTLLFVSTLLPFVLLTKNIALWAMGTPVEMAFIALEIAACGLIFAVDAVGHRVNGYKWGLFWTFPLGMAVIFAIFWNSAWRIKSGRGAVWKGRVVEAGGTSSRR